MRVQTGLQILLLVDRHLARKRPRALGWRTLTRLRGEVAKIRRPTVQYRLTQILEAIAAPSGPRILGRQLLRYADQLERSGEFSLAIDVHRLLIRRSEQRSGFGLIRAYSHLGYCLRESGSTDEGLRVYKEGVEWAARHRNHRMVAHLKIGQANTLRAIGRLTDARAILDSVLERSRTLGDRNLLGRAAHERGIVAHQLGNYVDALTCYADALASFHKRGPRTRLLNDIGLSSWRVGLINVARKAFVHNYLTAPESFVRWSAGVNLMALATTSGHEDSFHQYCGALARAPLPARLRQAYWLEYGDGCVRFGDSATARMAHLNAIRLADEYRLKGCLRDAYLAFLGLRPSSPEVQIQPAALPPPVQRLIAYVSQLSELPPTKQRPAARRGRSFGRKHR